MSPIALLRRRWRACERHQALPGAVIVLTSTAVVAAVGLVIRVATGG